jgi:hypothetical protein
LGYYSSVGIDFDSDRDATWGAEVPGQGLIEGQWTGSLDDDEHRERKYENMVFNSVAFFVPIPIHKEPEFSVNCKQRYTHNYGDAERGDTA